jgi:hypothetical protein
MKSYEQIDLIFKMLVLAASKEEESYQNVGERVLASADLEYQGVCKDLEKLGYKVEMVKIEGLAEYLEVEMGLSPDKSMEFSKIIFNFLKIKNQRSVSPDDADHIVNKFLGVNFNVLKEAIEFHISGNSKDYDEIMKRAAGLNGISQDQMSTLMEDFVLSVWCRRSAKA